MNTRYQQPSCLSWCKIRNIYLVWIKKNKIKSYCEVLLSRQCHLVICDQLTWLCVPNNEQVLNSWGCTRCMQVTQVFPWSWSVSLTWYDQLFQPRDWFSMVLFSLAFCVLAKHGWNDFYWPCIITLLRIASFTIIIFVYLLQRVTVKKMAPYQQSTLNLRFQDWETNQYTKQMKADRNGS